MKLQYALLATGLLAATPQTPSGSAILSLAAASQGLTSFSVPVHFDVHVRRPIGIKSTVEGVAYYKAPSRAAIALTRIPGLLGSLCRGSYTLDMVPQTWPAKYDVTSVSIGQEGGVYELQAVPKDDPSVDHVVFGVTTADDKPVSAQWFYKDGSSIQLTIANQQVQGYTLPLTETVSVVSRRYSLDASATYGQYAVNTPVDDSIFSHS
jgi:hypothetical protein